MKVGDCNGVEKSLRECVDELKSLEMEINLVGESVAARAKEVESRKGSIENHFKDFQENVERFNLFQQEKTRELCSMREDLKLREEKVEEKDKLLNAFIERLVEALPMGSEVVIESFERKLEVVEGLVAKREKDIDVRKGLLDKSIIEFEMKESEFNLFQEKKTSELLSKEKQLSAIEERLIADIKSNYDTLTKREKSLLRFMQKVESVQGKVKGASILVRKKFEEVKSSAQNVRVADELMSKRVKEVDLIKASFEKRIKEFENREQNVRVAEELMAKRVKEVDLINASLEKRIKEFENRKLKFNDFEKERSRELELKENQARMTRKENAEEVQLPNKIMTGQKERLHEVSYPSAIISKNLRMIGSQDQTLTVALSANDADSIQMAPGKRLREVENRENKSHCQNKKIKTMVSEQEKFSLMSENFMKEAGLTNDKSEEQEKWVRRLELAQNGVEDLRTMARRRSNETSLIESGIHRIRSYIEGIMDGVGSKSKQIEEHGKDSGVVGFKELELKRQQSTDAMTAHVSEEPAESADLKFVVKMDGKTLQMFLNDPEKDTESIGDEVFKVLQLSSDPAKLVLDAMEGFYPPHLREGDVDYNVRRTCILLLEQLTKMSKNIKPCLKEKAFILAKEWKSRMKTNPEDLLEVLGFLHLLDAYNLVLYFDKDELLSLLKIVAQHRQLPPAWSSSWGEKTVFIQVGGIFATKTVSAICTRLAYVKEKEIMVSSI